MGYLKLRHLVFRYSFFFFFGGGGVRDFKTGSIIAIISESTKLNYQEWEIPRHGFLTKFGRGLEGGPGGGFHSNFSLYEKSKTQPSIAKLSST